jgi:uncharacterized membrane protein (UPF0127 family)
MLAAAALALAAAGCGSGGTADAPPEPKTVAEHFTIDVGGHPTHQQLAVLMPEQERGLMDRTDLGKDDGMVFMYAKPQRMSFWMHNTPEALDIAFVRPDGTIAEIYPMYPFDERTVASRSDQIQFAVEMPQGWFSAAGVRAGARVDEKELAEALKARGFSPEKFGLR